jgi:3-methyladenine DNA glycosylase AlkD
MRTLPIKNTPVEREALRKHARRLAAAPAEFILALAKDLIQTGDNCRWLAYELVAGHRAAFRAIGEAELAEFGRGMNSWWTVDAFARTLAGPAWLKGQVSNELILRWARSADRWWRRAALASTVALNVRSHGGKGDVPRTLAVCRVLAADPEDMVVKAMSWALRELVVHDPQAVQAFLDEHAHDLAARVIREVKHKLATGLKNPRRQTSHFRAGES